MSRKLHVLAVAPYCDGTDVGEAHCAYMWIKELSKEAQVTVITQHRSGRLPLKKQLPNVRVLARREPTWTTRFERLNAMAKLAYPGFLKWAKKVIREQIKEGVTFDIGHQFSPIALRYPSPLNGSGIPYVIGPLGGSLETPEGFKKECGSSAFFTRLRGLDKMRLKYDAALKKTYREAELVLGVAPYVEDLLKPAEIKRFEVMSELGVAALSPPSEDKFLNTGSLRILHVGRGVRTKGLRDVIRAMALVSDLPGLHLDVAGKGEEMPICEALAAKLGLKHRVTFHGQIPREKVDELYKKADVFCFPSFREPSGSVIFEALSHGLPAIVANYGGPGHVIDDTCGFQVPVTKPGQFEEDIAAALRTVARMPELRHSLSNGATAKMQSVAIWPTKISNLQKYYEQILQSKSNVQEEKQQCVRHPKFLQSHQAEATGSNSCV